MNHARSLILVTLAAVAASACERRHPTDGELVENFREHREQFEVLRRMLGEDRSLSSIAVGSGVDDGTNTISAERLAQYRALLRELGVRGGVAVSPDRKAIELTVSVRGFVTHGSEKGYVFDPAPRDDEPVLPDLDRFGAARERGAGRRELDGGWSLYFRGD